MPARTNSIENKRPLPLVCPRDGHAMSLVRVTPRLGALPEVRTYRFDRCGAVDTVEVKRLVAAAS